MLKWIKRNKLEEEDDIVPMNGVTITLDSRIELTETEKRSFLYNRQKKMKHKKNYSGIIRWWDELLIILYKPWL